MSDFTTRGWFETDDDHEEFEALIRHHRKLAEDMDYRIGRTRGYGLTLLVGSPLLSLVAAWRDVDWGQSLALFMVAIAVYCFYSLVGLEKRRVQKAREHSAERDQLLATLTRFG